MGHVMKFLFSFIFIILLVPTLASTQYLQQTNGPNGASVKQFVADNTGKIYLLSESYQMFVSSDMGEHWTGTGADLLQKGVSCLAIDSSNGLWAATYDSLNVYYSTDYGVSWTPRGTGISSMVAVNSIFVHSSGKIYAATSSGVYKWSEQNLQWEIKSNGLTILPCFAMDSYDDSILYVGTNNGGFFKSTNLGETWARSGFITTTYQIKSIVVDSNGNKFACIPFGIYRSSHGDTTWADISSQFPTTFLADVHSDKRTGSIFFTCSKGIFKASNEGLTWNSITGSGIRVNWINEVICPDFTSMFVGLTDAGVYKSINGGVSWVEKNNGLIISDIRGMATTNSGTVTTAMWGGVFSTSDKGNTWVDLSVSLPNYLVSSVFYTKLGAILAGTSGGIYRSTNNGSLWSNANTGMTATPAEVFLSNSDGTIFTGAQGGGVFRSTNDGMSWDVINNGIVGLSVQTIARNQNDQLYVSIGGGSIFTSTNNGDSWSLLKNLETDVQSILADTSGLILAGTSEAGIYRSTDGGSTFLQITNELAGEGIYTLERNKGGHILAGTAIGLYRSLDFGQTWERMDGLSANSSVVGIQTDPNNYMYCGVRDEGVWKSSGPMLVYFRMNEYNAGDVIIGDSSIVRIRFYNPAVYTLSLQNLSFSQEGMYRIHEAPSLLVPLDSGEIQIVFKPTTLGYFIDTLKIVTNLDSMYVIVSGNGIDNTGISTSKNDLVLRVTVLDQNYPNPFNPSTTIRFGLPEACHVRLAIYDLLGKEIAVLIDQNYPHGYYVKQWNASALASGIYFYRLNAGSFVNMKKLVLLK
jgi:photosystem II stability/assembly factor-like uncharacterized protein